MNDYIIYTDSACDVSPGLLWEWGVHCSCLRFHFEGEEGEYSNDAMPIDAFYVKMHAGAVAKTSAVNVGTFLEAFERLLREGKDILYLGFASTLSATFNSAAMAAEQLREKYPQRRLLTVDTLCASAGQAMVVKETVDRKNAGASLEEAAAFAAELSGRVCQWITVEDLAYLKRGGRISPTTALVGKALGIKPLIYINAKGRLDSVDKARGRKKAVTALADYYGRTAKDPGGAVYIARSEFDDGVALLTELLRQRYGARVSLVTDIGPVVGAHIGPGGMFLAFEGEAR